MDDSNDASGEFPPGTDTHHEDASHLLRAARQVKRSQGIEPNRKFLFFFGNPNKSGSDKDGVADCWLKVKGWTGFYGRRHTDRGQLTAGVEARRCQCQ